MRDFKVYQASGMLNFLVNEASDVRKKEQTLSGDIVSFPADEQSPLKIVVDINSTGWTGCEVYRTGVNVWDEEWVNGRWSGSSGVFNPNFTTYVASKNAIRVKPNTTYFFFVNSAVTTAREVVFYDANDDWISDLNSLYQNSAFTTPNNAYYIRFNLGAGYGATYNHDVSINYPSTDTDYHAHQGTTLSVTFPDEVGTVTEGTLTIDYDGSVTLETGGQTYTLTSVSPIETLIGDNNIWSDAGPVSVTYPI